MGRRNIAGDGLWGRDIADAYAFILLLPRAQLHLEQPRAPPEHLGRAVKPRGSQPVSHVACRAQHAFQIGPAKW